MTLWAERRGVSICILNENERRARNVKLGLEEKRKERTTIEWNVIIKSREREREKEALHKVSTPEGKI